MSEFSTEWLREIIAERFVGGREGFDRWLAEVERAAAERAVREMADYLTVETVDPAYEGQGNDGEFGSGFYQGIRACRRALRARAEAYRKGDDA